jgi:CheY-like chemotaxis protein
MTAAGAQLNGTHQHSGPLAGRRVLVVEDDFLLGQTLAELLEDEGATVLGPVGSVDQALAFLADRAGEFDHVILDLNLHGIKSYPVADALARSNVPFVFATGYSADAIDAAYRGYPHCVKPLNTASVLAVFGYS